MINWILGLNPYDMCMLQGVGKNNPTYLEPHDWNYKGGVCNGYTSGWDNKNDITFTPSEGDNMENRWRWGEQWIPHSAWLMLAVSSLQ